MKFTIINFITINNLRNDSRVYINFLSNFFFLQKPLKNFLIYKKYYLIAVAAEILVVN
jgi:hypothetical protein